MTDLRRDPVPDPGSDKVDDAGARRAIEGGDNGAAGPLPVETKTAPARPPRYTEGPGTVIGRYKLLQQIGKGGFGAVYMAEQKHPVKRKVALKIIKLGMDTKQVIARFEAERQALAMMDHPNIARVLDAGATETGRPFFVMELVKGVPFTEYCDTESLPTRDRLHLFIAVCRAVQHAHQKGIIHRDLKPNNVMVTLHDGHPVPKVIDFGIAKATNRELTDKTLFTEYRQLIGTPAYMSPEQAEMSGLDLDTRSDIYSLGVLLYELLTGTTPFDSKRFRGMDLGRIQQVIREEEPHKPSTRLSEMSRGRFTPGSGRTAGTSRKTSVQYITKHRRTDIAGLRREISGDLDWIIMKCLEKDRSRRYETANGLARDVERHLSDEPVAAGPPSRSYRLRKAIRRNKGSFVVAVLIALLLIGGVTGTTIGMVRAQRAQAKAELVASLLTDMLESVGPDVAQGRDTTLLRKMVDDIAKRVSTELAGQPDVEATIRNTLGVTYRELGEYPAAEPHLRKALDLRRQYFGDKHEAVAESLFELAWLLAEKGEYNESESLYRQSLAMRRELLGDEHQDVAASLNDLAAVLGDNGDTVGAEPLYREALAMRRKLLGDDHPDTLESINNMGALLYQQGKLAEAEPYSRQALETKRRVLGNEHPKTLTSINNMGALLWKQGKVAEAEPYVREALEGRRRALGEEHPETLQSINNMGALLQQQGKLAEAEGYSREALETKRRVLGDEHPNTLNSINSMGALLTRQGKLAEAEPYCREALESRRRVLGDDHPDTLNSINNMGGLLNQLGRHEAAVELLKEGELAARRVYTGGNAKQLGNYLAKLGEAQTGLQKFAAAERTLLEAHTLLLAGFGTDHKRTVKCVKRLIALYEAWDTAEPGKGYDAKAAEWREKLPAGD